MYSSGYTESPCKGCVNRNQDKNDCLKTCDFLGIPTKIYRPEKKYATGPRKIKTKCAFPGCKVMCTGKFCHEKKTGGLGHSQLVNARKKADPDHPERWLRPKFT